jgi:uncharacterized membrane protein YhaH (DUF805 family)
MTFPQAIVTCYKNYFRFNGRATRAEFWWFVLFAVLATLALRALDYSLFGADPLTGKPVRSLSNLFTAITFLPLLTAGWRRMQDTGKPGWLILAPISLSVIFALLSIAGASLFALLDEIATLNKTPYILAVIAVILYAIASALLTGWTLWSLAAPSRQAQDPKYKQSI